MQGNFIMLQRDDLKQVVAEMVEELVGKKPQTDLTQEESDEYFTRDQVCERLHITYTTLWRMQKGELLSFTNWADAIFTQRRKSPHF